MLQNGSKMDGKRKILMIDDDLSVRMLLEYLLRSTYFVKTQKDGIEGMMWLDDGNLPDLILLDTDMPRLNGYEFLKNIRKSGFFRNIPVIMLVGSDDSENIINYLHQGANDVLLKPFNPKDLYEKIENIITN